MQSSRIVGNDTHLYLDIVLAHTQGNAIFGVANLGKYLAGFESFLHQSLLQNLMPVLVPSSRLPIPS